MKCYCYETEKDFIFCVENAEVRCEENLKAAWWEKHGERFLKIYPNNFADQKELISKNFARLGEAMFNDFADWKSVLMQIAEKFCQNKIEWYIIGSVSEAVLGVDIKSHDLDIIMHTKDFYRVKGIFSEFIVGPFVDNKGTWLMRYFGRLCINGIVDIAADDKMNLENRNYNKVNWNGYDIFVEPLGNVIKRSLSEKEQIELKRLKNI